MSGPSFSYGNQYTPASAAPAQATAAPLSPPAGDGLVRDTTTKDFVRDVIDASRTVPVLVDFWAEWCGPCKQLTPVIEKVVRNAKGKVKLVKMNIDHHPEIAGQLGIRSIPAVIAFKNGQPLDGFMGAVPESQIQTFIERVAGPMGPSDAETLMAEAEAALEAGDLQGAADLFSAVRELEPDHVGALGGLVRTLVAARNSTRRRRSWRPPRPPSNPIPQLRARARSWTLPSRPPSSAIRSTWKRVSAMTRTTTRRGSIWRLR